VERTRCERCFEWKWFVWQSTTYTLIAVVRIKQVFVCAREHGVSDIWPEMVRVTYPLKSNRLRQSCEPKQAFVSARQNDVRDVLTRNGSFGFGGETYLLINCVNRANQASVLSDARTRCERCFEWKWKMVRLAVSDIHAEIESIAVVRIKQVFVCAREHGVSDIWPEMVRVTYPLKSNRLRQSCEPKQAFVSARQNDVRNVLTRNGSFGFGGETYLLINCVNRANQASVLSHARTRCEVASFGNR
jgi:hypothetical protein